MISVIIPAFNSEKTISKTIQSILNQEVKKEFELIIVDDTSTDNTLTEIKKFKNIVLIQQEKNKGPAAARNLGAKKAKGETIIFTDSDCIPEKNWLEEMIKPFENPKVVGVQGSYKTKQKSLTARFIQLEIEDRYDLMQKEMKKKGLIDFIGSYSAAYRKKEFMEFNGFNEKFPTASGEDPELSYRMEKKGLKLVFNPNATVFHSHPESFLQYIKTKFFRGYWRVLMYRTHKDKIIYDSYTPQVLKFQILILYALIIQLIVRQLNETIQFNPIIKNSISSAFDVFISVLFIVFLVTIIPFFMKNLKKDFLAGILSPIFVFFRTFSFCSGLIIGIIKVKK
ncbi:glycosyltransferase [Candidatus Micrarchaeota archaeon]|nr:glycosyltransferase [Candidatus Micrarchaeota archaeon]MBU2476708.1 glycosyltransferase [Candidatus Micrarchaeota archaeon]